MIGLIHWRKGSSECTKSTLLHLCPCPRGDPAQDWRESQEFSLRGTISSSGSQSNFKLTPPPPPLRIQASGRKTEGAYWLPALKWNAREIKHRRIFSWLTLKYKHSKYRWLKQDGTMGHSESIQTLPTKGQGKKPQPSTIVVEFRQQCCCGQYLIPRVPQPQHWKGWIILHSIGWREQKSSPLQDLLLQKQADLPPYLRRYDPSSVYSKYVNYALEIFHVNFIYRQYTRYCI